MRTQYEGCGCWYFCGAIDVGNSWDAEEREKTTNGGRAEYNGERQHNPGAGPE